MKVEIEIHEDYMKHLCDVTEETENEVAIHMAIQYTLDNY